eukprot:1429734-Rhodomonas_salina.1
MALVQHTPGRTETKRGIGTGPFSAMASLAQVARTADEDAEDADADEEKYEDENEDEDEVGGERRPGQ